MRTFLLLCIACCVLGCNETPKLATVTDQTMHFCLAEGHDIWFLGSKDAADAIVHDTVTPYFKQLTPLDMAIQMHEEDFERLDADTLRPMYLNYLRKRAGWFTGEEQDLLKYAARRTWNALQLVRPELYPPRIRFIKSDGENYGDNMYFTREDAIVIPQKAIKYALRGDTATFYRAITHEIFHLITRQNPNLRQQLYQRIGFDTIQQVVIRNPHLAKRRLGNPDGTGHCKIRLSDTTFGYMLSASPTETFDGREDFGEYLAWEMYQVVPRNGAWEVVTDSLGESTLSNTWEVPFYRQVTTNTEYTLHPDEICADNFVLLLQWKTDPKSVHLDESGIKLLQDMERIFKAYRLPKKQGGKGKGRSY